MLLFIAGGGCARDPDAWDGSCKLLELHAVCFTPSGDGLLLVGPRRTLAEGPNATAYYYYDLSAMKGRRLGYGQFSLGAALACPFDHVVAIPIFVQDEVGQVVGHGYQIHDLAGEQIIREEVIDAESMFLPHTSAPADVADAGGLTAVGQVPPPATQPAGNVDQGVDMDRIWARLIGRPLSRDESILAARPRPRWLIRGAGADPPFQVRTVDGQSYYLLESPDGQHQLFLRFQAPGSRASTSADPDGEGFANGYVVETRTGRRRILFDTTGTDETFEAIGSALAAGPVWIGKAIAKMFGG